MERIKLLNCYFDPIDFLAVVGRCEDYIKQKNEPHHIIVMNACLLVQFRKNEELRKSVSRASIVAPDGVPVVWASKLLGVPLPGRVNGTDLMDELIKRSSHRGYRVYFLGATEEVLKTALRICKEKYPALNIAGWHNGYFLKEEESKVIEDIRKSNSDILFIGMNSPYKEIWVSKNLNDLNVPVCHGVGGSLDVLSGKIKRAPKWMQNNGLEWLFRFIQEPARTWKRYTVGNVRFIWLVLKELISK